MAVNGDAVDLRLLPFVLGAVLLETGLIVFFNDIPSISAGSPPGGGIYAPVLSLILFLGVLFLMYGLIQGKKSVSEPLQ